MSDAAAKVGAGKMFGIAYDVTPSDGCPNRASLAREEVSNHVLRFQISDFRFQISDFRFQVSDFRFQISDFRG
jgi:hypothetical protein